MPSHDPRNSKSALAGSASSAQELPSPLASDSRSANSELSRSHFRAERPRVENYLPRLVDREAAAHSLHAGRRSDAAAANRGFWVVFGDTSVIDTTRQRFGRLVAQWPVGRLGVGQVAWLCLCDCGNFKTISRNKLITGHTKSCGCLVAEVSRRRFTTHGHNSRGVRSSEYTTWDAMIQRCTNPHCCQFRNYGGRGISVCKRWMKFENFFADMGRRPTGKSIDRINNNGNYEPGNCKWSTPSEQLRNRRPVTEEARRNMSKARSLYYTKKREQQKEVRA